MTVGRAHAVVSSAAGLVPFGHLGWGYRHRREFLRRAAEYAIDGLRCGQYVIYVADGTPRTLAAEADQLRGELAADVADGPIAVSAVSDFYEFVAGTDVVDPEASVRRRVEATERAVSDGHTGFRAIVDATAVSRTPEQAEAFSVFEYLVDRQMVSLPVSALCAFDRAGSTTGSPAPVCMHPYVNSTAGFQLYATDDADLAASGEVDKHGSEPFMRDVRRIWRQTGRQHFEIDGTDLAVAETDTLRALDTVARDDGVEVTLRTTHPDVAAVAAAGGDLTHLRTVLTPGAVAHNRDVDLIAEVSHLRSKLANAPAIEQAKGMLMQAYGLTDDDAFCLLKVMSQQNNAKLRDVAGLLVERWRSDGPRPDRDTATDFLLQIQNLLG